MLIPNSKLLEETLVKSTLLDKPLRYIIRVGVVYGSDVEKFRNLLNQALRNHEMVLTEPATQITFENFGDNSLVFDAYFWIHSAGENCSRQIRSDICFTVDRLFREHEITIALPQRDIHIDGTLHVQK
jgi:small-conductance mechanosensitive channel